MKPSVLAREPHQQPYLVLGGQFEPAVPARPGSELHEAAPLPRARHGGDQPAKLGRPQPLLVPGIKWLADTLRSDSRHPINPIELIGLRHRSTISSLATGIYSGHSAKGRSVWCRAVRRHLPPCARLPGEGRAAPARERLTWPRWRSAAESAVSPGMG